MQARKTLARAHTRAKMTFGRVCDSECVVLVCVFCGARAYLIIYARQAHRSRRSGRTHARASRRRARICMDGLIKDTCSLSYYSIYTVCAARCVYATRSARSSTVSSSPSSSPSLSSAAAMPFRRATASTTDEFHKTYDAIASARTRAIKIASARGDGDEGKPCAPLCRRRRHRCC